MALRKEPQESGLYRFSLRKRYSYETRYKKVEKPIIEQAKERIFSLMGKKPAAPAAAPARGRAPEEKEKKGAPIEVSPLLALRVGGLFGLLALLLLGIFLFAQTVSMPEERWTTEVSSASVSAAVLDSDIITSGSAENFRYPYHTAYSNTRITSSGLPNITMGAALYDSIVPSSVFVLRSNRYQAESYDTFLSSLSMSLSESGIEANEISVSELDRLSSGSMLIVPSGYIPEELVSGSKPMLYSLMERGITVFYIGQDFSRMISKTGSVVPTPSSFTTYRDGRISFDAGASMSPDSTVSIKNPLYGASGLDSSWSFGGAYSVLAYRGGFIILAPQTLDGGWETGSAAGDDAANIILITRWLTPKASAEAVRTLTGDDYVEFFTPSFEGSSGYLKIYGINKESQVGFYKVAFVQKGTKGEIYSRGHSIMPGDIASTPLDLIIELKESGGEKFLFLSITNVSGEVERSSIAGTKVGLNSQPTIQHTFTLPTGDYILNVVDQEGNIYARSYLRAKKIGIVPVFYNMRTDVYSFSFRGDGEPVSPDSVTATIDGGQYGTYTFRGTSSLTIDMRAAGYSLSDGMHSITFQSGSYTSALALDKTAPPAFYTQPFFLGSAVIALVALAVAYIFKASEIPVYGLDIPDFPPQYTTKVPLKKDVLLGLFEKVNQKYRWKNTPLKASEVKGAFKDVLFEGRPVFISDYNLEYLLDQLTGLGLLKKEAGYYSKSSWEQETGLSAKYLSMFRSLRDICINEAIPFTPMGASKEYDTKITILGQDMYVHFYEGPQAIATVMGSLQLGLNIILAEDEGEVEELNEFLSSGDGPATLLKLEVQSGSVQIKTLGDLQKMIKEMKV
ncbi:hypothetical protein H0O01_02485 [Candidatus Micrarchaeota archaeon]|nr:hypothetical protein [Candidatus Micrarchaeota archaeon]